MIKNLCFILFFFNLYAFILLTSTCALTGTLGNDWNLGHGSVTSLLRVISLSFRFSLTARSSSFKDMKLVCLLPSRLLSQRLWKGRSIVLVCIRPFSILK